MVNSFLFGNQSSSQSKYLIEFKAGKMQMKGTTVNPINKKGLVYLHHADDNLVHFCWKDRTSGQVDVDLIIFPGDTEFKKVPQCTTGRVFVLKFKSSSRRNFFWMQEANADKDDEICKKVNELLNSQSVSTRNSNVLGHSLTDLPESELHNLISNVNSQQLMQMLSRVNAGSDQVLASFLNRSISSRIGRNSNSSGSSNAASRSITKASTVSNINQETSAQSPSNTPTTTPTVSSATPATPATSAAAPAGIQLSDLQNIISGLAVNQNKKEITVDLASIVNSEALKKLLENNEFMDKVKELIPDTTDGQPNQSLAQQVSSTIESVQFKSALSTFNSALQSGLLGPLVQQFNLSAACVEAANKGDLEAFVKAMEESSKEDTSSDKKDPGGDDIAME